MRIYDVSKTYLIYMSYVCVTYMSVINLNDRVVVLIKISPTYGDILYGDKSRLNRQTCASLKTAALQNLASSLR